MQQHRWGVWVLMVFSLMPILAVGCGDDAKEDGTQAQNQPTDQSEAEASSRYMEEQSKKGAS